MKRVRLALVLLALIATLVAAVPAAAAPGSLPGSQPGAAPALDTVYIVRPGDTLAKIAARFGTTVTAIMRANPTIRNVNRIYVGQRLVIPGGTTATFTRVKIAMIALESGGTVGCGDSVVMVTRDVRQTTAPLTASMVDLLSHHDDYYGMSGLYNALYQSRLTVQSVTLVNGLATIRLTGTFAQGGVCDSPRIKAQFESTARQFSTVKQVKVFINGQSLDSLLSLQ